MSYNPAAFSNLRTLRCNWHPKLKDDSSSHYLLRLIHDIHKMIRLAPKLRTIVCGNETLALQVITESLTPTVLHPELLTFVTKLETENVGMDVHGTKHIAKCLMANNHLTELNLASVYWISTSSFCRSPHFVSGNRFGYEGFINLNEALLQNKTLKKLNLNRAFLFGGGVSS